MDISICKGSVWFIRCLLKVYTEKDTVGNIPQDYLYVVLISQSLNTKTTRVSYSIPSVLIFFTALFQLVLLMRALFIFLE